MKRVKGDKTCTCSQLAHPRRAAAADLVATAVVLVAVFVGDGDATRIVGAAHHALGLLGLRAVLQLGARAVVATRHAGGTLVLVALRQNGGRARAAAQRVLGIGARAADAARRSRTAGAARSGVRAD